MINVLIWGALILIAIEIDWLGNCVKELTKELRRITRRVE